MTAKNAANTAISTSTSTTTIRSMSTRALGARASFFDSASATSSTNATPVSKADTVNSAGSNGVLHRGTLPAAISSMPVYTATNAPSTMPITASTRRSATPRFSNHFHFFASHTPTGRVANNADTANTAIAANAPQAP